MATVPAPKPSNIVVDNEPKITVGNVQYLLVPHHQNFLGFSGDTDVALMVVYLVEPDQAISATDLRDFRTNVLDKDDVFQPEFCRNFVFYAPGDNNSKLQPEAKDELVAWNTKTMTFVRGDLSSKVAPGPYVSTRGRTWQPWRVYRDFNATLMCGFKPSSESPGSLVVLDTSEAGTNQRVIVPSRCYFKPSKSRPLDGARITVKDNIDIAGHKTSLCNRAWQELYPPSSKNAHCVQVLIDAGAIIVGKAKLMAMIMREEPLECVEFTAPFNPRGDGYQISSGSSHGSAAGVASYDWLDFSIGSDTNGSGRKPAHYNGCFSIRPSTGIMNTAGVIGQFPPFDMPVFFGRDISTFAQFISVWYGESPMLRTLPNPPKVKILYPADYLPTVNNVQTHLINNFVKGLERALNIKRTKISLAGTWSSDLPDGVDNQDLKKYLELAGSYPYYREAYYSLVPFVMEYQNKFGKRPFIHKAMLWQWDIAKKITKKERDFYWRRSETYRKWLLSNIFDASSQDTITVMVLPIMDGKPAYRDAELPPYYVLSGYSPLNMSPMMQAPEVTAIVGETTHDSRVSHRLEPLPIAVSLIGAPGTDLILVDLVERAMKAAEIPTKVQTGRYVYGSPSGGNQPRPQSTL
ncbi:amidase [Chaetomium sp. MPI-SDFR-AT-0129]|nr:amidase [Chaetomium sp. MPI-SDFR-AT-0129]